MIRSKDVVHMSWWGSPCYMSSCASPDSCGSRQLVAWDVERVAAGGCRRVRTWTRLCRRTCSSSSSSPSPPPLAGPPGRHHTHHTLHGEWIKGESCGGGGWRGGGTGRSASRTAHGTARTSAPPLPPPPSPSPHHTPATHLRDDHGIRRPLTTCQLRRVRRSTRCLRGGGARGGGVKA